MKRECCAKAENLEKRKQDGDKVILVCRVCGARQIRMQAEPGVIGLRLG